MGPIKYGVMKNGNLMQFPGTNKITSTKKTAKLVVKILGGQLVKVEITPVIE